MIRDARRGIALIVTIGILVLLSAAAVAMVRMAAQLRERSGLSVDRISARLLARAGVEYAQARLVQSFAAPAARTLENQADDWAFRDDPSMPLEKSLNPSYAQTEPYTDLYPPHLSNGRFDPGLEPYTDVIANGRLDSWSGRLRSRYGMTSGTFALKVGGEGAGAGLNVNSGMLDNTDINGNKIPDYRDIALPGGHYYPPWITLHQGRNCRIAVVINQLASLLGMARAVMKSPRIYTTGTPLGDQSVSTSQTAGELIIGNRPLGGYQDVDEMAKLFPLPDEWGLLRPHLSVFGRRNPAARYWLKPQAYGEPDWQAGYWLVPDNEYFIDVEKASLETLAALFVQRGWWDGGSPTASPFNPECYIHSDEALKVARFLKEQEFKSWYDLYWKLKANASALFLPWIVSDGNPETQAESYKAVWVHSLSIPDEPLYPAFRTYRSWASYDDPPHTTGNPEQFPQRGSLYTNSCALWTQYHGAPTPYMQEFERLYVETRTQAVSGSSGLESSKGSAAQPLMGGLAIFSIESLGRVSGGDSRPRASSTSRGEFSRGMTELHAAGMIAARTQDDFENLNFDRECKSFHYARRFDGGTIEGRPTRDRAGTTPCFSRDACMELSRDPLVMASSYPPYVAVSYDCGPPPTLPKDVFYDFNYCRFYGEVMPLARSWPDPQEIVYLPYWDLDQPERPRPGPAAFRFQSNWDDVAQGIPMAAPPRWNERILGWGTTNHNVFYSWTPLGACPLADCYFDGPGWYPKRRLLLTDEAANTDGSVRSGSFVGWSHDEHEAYNNGATFPDRYPIQYRDQVANARKVNMLASPSDFYAFYEGGGITASIIVWNNPASPNRKKDIHVVFTFGNGRFDAYVDGVWRGTDDYEPYVVSPPYESASVRGAFEFRLYRSALEAPRIAAHALKGRFWTADGPDYEKVPSFTSPLYRFDHRAKLLRIGWDGFIPNVLRDAVNSKGGPTPLRVELLLYRKGTSSETPVIVPLPEDSWKTGGCRAKFPDLWKSAASGISPTFKALRYRVWLDASGLDLAWETPVFDGIEISYKFGRDGDNGE